jgi:membrane fusion protein (multidrug efflux system)
MEKDLGTELLSEVAALASAAARHRRQRRWTLGLGAATAAATLLVTLWTHTRVPAPAPKNSEAALPVETTELRLTPFRDEVETNGTLKGEAEIELRFETPGTIVEFKPNEGSLIKKGQVIARLDDRDARIDLEEAQIEVEEALRLEKLGQASPIQARKARVKLEKARRQLEKTQLIAPRDGILALKTAETGELLSPERAIARLVAIDNVILEAGVIERLVDRVYPGQKVDVRVDARRDEPFSGTVAYMSPVVSEVGGRTLSIRCRIPNPGRVLLPGMFARVRIVTFEKSDGLVVPADALQRTQTGFQLFLVNRESRVEPRAVTLAYVGNESVLIEKGVEPGDVVVLHPSPELRARTLVRPVVTTR